MTAKAITELIAQMKQTEARRQELFAEGEAAYYSLLCNYSLGINPYKASPEPWASYHWQCGFQNGYFEQNRYKLAKAHPEPEYNMRNEGYENHYYPVGRD